MEMDFKEYIPWIGGLLFGLVALHALYLVWRSRRARRAEAQADAEQGRDSLPPVLVEPLTEEPDDADPLAPQYAQDSSHDENVDAPAPALQSNAVDAAAKTAPVDDAPTAEPPRFVIAGKRTEPTVPRDQRPLGAEAQDRGPQETPEETAPTVDQVMVLWVSAKSGATLDGTRLMQALKAHGLEHNDGVFYKRDAVNNGEQFMVANGVEPGTFNVANIGALATPRIALLLRLAAATNPTQAFEDMLEVAQDVAISLGAEIQDESKSALNSHIIDQCRRRIREYKRLSQQV